MKSPTLVFHFTSLNIPEPTPAAMTVFNSEMHVVTFILIILEVLMFMHYYIFYLQKPDKKRKFYLILLFVLIIYNVAGWLFPYESMNLSILNQNILSYGA